MWDRGRQARQYVVDPFELLVLIEQAAAGLLVHALK